MENDDNTTMTPVQASNQSAALPGSGGSAGPASGSSGGASAAYGGGVSTAAPMEAAPSPVSQPYATMTTPTAVNVPTPRQRPFAGPNPRLREDVVTQPSFGAKGAREIQWTAQSSLTREQEEAVRTEAGRLGVAPSTLAAVIAYETIGTFDIDIQGGTGGNYRGLIQFGPNERRDYGYRDGMTFEEQLAGPVHNYLVDRGVRPGHGIAEVYSIINAGSLRNGQPRWGASDRPGWNVRRHVDEITSTRLPEFTYLDEGWSPPREEVDIPNPRLRPASDDPALGARGARFMGDTAAIDADTFMPTQLAGAVNGEGQIVERGWRGGSVRELQTFLNDNGYTDARGRPLRVDGDFGRRTKEAVKSFQAASQIEVDGRVGPETLSAILYTVDPSSSPMPGQVAYVDGANAARSIINPSAPEIAIPLPRQRPERGAGIPDPRMNPRRDPLGFMVDVDRPAIRNADGSISTERTETFEVDGQFWNIPTIVGGEQLSSDQAFAEYEAGRNAAVQGPFASADEAVSAA
jgi:peptidoglycan hydrolase-like protein with peptidoglycan-binding domain